MIQKCNGQCKTNAEHLERHAQGLGCFENKEKLFRPKYYELPITGRLEDWIKYMPMFRGTAIKYLARCGLKDDPIKELKKAKECINIEIDRIEQEKILTNGSDASK